MFIEITKRGLGPGPTNTVSYAIIDSCFTKRVVLKSPSSRWDYRLAIALINTYKERNLNVVANLAKYYNYLYHDVGADIGAIIPAHYGQIDNSCCSIQYNKLYYPLLKNYYLKQMLPKYH